MSRLFPLAEYPKDKYNPLMGRCRDWGDTNFNIFLAQFENACLVKKGDTAEDYQYTDYFRYQFNLDMQQSTDRLQCRSCRKIINLDKYDLDGNLSQDNWYYISCGEDDGSTFYRIWCYNCEQIQDQKNRQSAVEFYSKVFASLLG